VTSNKSIIQVVPALSPPSNGVGDYALRVAECLKAQYSIDTTFIVAAPLHQRESEVGFPVNILREHSAASIARALEESALPTDFSAADSQFAMLQLSPYGFDKNGCPFWLVRGLRDWVCRDANRRKLITMFHELYAEGAPWTRTFWVSGLQRKATRDILTTTHYAMTGVQKFAQQLEAWSSGRRATVKCLPVPSNVGEPNAVPRISQRKRRICAFGIRAGGNPLSDSVVGVLRTVIGRGAIEEIAVLGDSPIAQTFEGLGCRVETYKGLAADELSPILLDTILGLSWYPPEVLAKSGIFAAYCAHGVPALVLGSPGRQSPSRDGLEPRMHFLLPSGVTQHYDPDQFQRISDHARQWYAGHGVAEHARTVAGFVHSENG